jgi:putative sporulation protein YyaC
MFNKILIDSSESNCIFTLRDSLSEIIFPIYKKNRPIIFLCIGTDRSTGDSLGPLVGDKLKFLIRDNVSLYGNLEKPVHAKNLCEVITEINSIYSDPFIIAIDACLGSLQNVGKIFIENKPLCPGAAMNKDLPAVGDISITGIVNISGALEFMVLQNTRLFTVMQLADIISKGIYHAIIKTFGGKKSNILDFEKQKVDI